MRKRVLIVTFDVVGPVMAGPGIRAWEFARVLGAHFPVTLAAPTPVPDDAPGFVLEAVPVGAGAMERVRDLIAEHDIVIAQMLPLDVLTEETWCDKYLLVDLYCPWMIENLEHHRAQNDPDANPGWLRHDIELVQQLALHGDFFFCAGERQRAFWLGALTLAGKLTPGVYDRDRDGRGLIDVVPFGTAAPPPPNEDAPVPPVLKGAIPGIAPGDFVALWGGGIWNWLDPLTLIRAAAILRDRGYPFRAFFLGTQRPSTDEKPTQPSMLAQALRLSDELGVTGSHVFFNERWVPYGERHRYLQEADAGISLHLPTLETRFAFRTRVLDYLWTGLVPVVHDGDTMADLLREHDAGVIVPIGDADALADALAALMDDRAEHDRLAARAHDLGRAYAWERVLEPLVAYCHNPQRGVPGVNVHRQLRNDISETRAEWRMANAYAARLEAEIRRKDAYIGEMEARAAAQPSPGLFAPLRRVSVRTMAARLLRARGGSSD